MLEKLQCDHPRMVRMKMIAHFYFWWPSLDEIIENYVKQRDLNHLKQNMSDSVLIHPSESPPKSHGFSYILICRILSQKNISDLPLLKVAIF